MLTRALKYIVSGKSVAHKSVHAGDRERADSRSVADKRQDERRGERVSKEES